MKYIKEKTRKYKANKITEMSQKELVYHQKTNRAAVEQHRAIKIFLKNTIAPIKILKTTQTLGKAKN